MPKLSDLKIDEVSLVRKGANQHAKVAIAKSVEPGGDVEIYDANNEPIDIDDLEDGDIVFGEDGQAYQYSTQADDDDDGEDDDEDYDPNAAYEGELVGKAGSSFMGKPLNQVPRFVRQARVGAIRANRAVGSAVSGFAQSHPMGTLGVAGGGAAAAGGGGYALGRKKNFGKSFEEEFSKALTDADRDAAISKAIGYIDELEQVAKSAQAVAEEEREARRNAEFYEVAKSYALPVSTDQLAKTMKNVVDRLDEDDVDTIQKCFQFASEAAIYDEVGNPGGGDNSDVMARLEASLEGTVAKSDLTKEQLLAKSFALDPDVYDVYLAEQETR